METLKIVLLKLGTSVERLRYFIIDAAVVCLLFLPALATWTVLILGYFNLYDFQLKNLRTERVLMLDSNEFQQAVDARIDEIMGKTYARK